MVMQTKDYIENIDGTERRTIEVPLEFRKDEEGEFFEGVAAVFDTTTDLGRFTESIDKRAFDEVINSDVRGLFNHDPNIVLGRTKSGTMKVILTDKELRYKIKYNPNDPDHVRVMEKVKRGDIAQSSFAFKAKDEKWDVRNGRDHRHVKMLEKWADVSPVTYAAYQNTNVAARSLDKINNDYKKDLAEMEIESMKHELNFK